MKFNRVRAFTLTELLVAVMLLMVVLMLLFSLFSHVAASYEKTESRADTYRDGRAALYLISKEIERLIDFEHRLGIAAPAIPRIEVDTGSPSSFAFVMQLPQSGQPSASMESDVCIVGYFVEADPFLPGGQALYRVLIPSRETYGRLTAAGQSTLLSESDKTSAAPYAEPIANNVVDFKIRVLDPQFAEVPTPTGSPEEAYLELSLTVIGNRMAQAYYEAPEERQEQIKEQEGRTFTVRMMIGALSTATSSPSP